MKKIVNIALLLLFTLGLGAQPEGPRKFDPKKFEADLEQFITTEAGLSPVEASRFFPLYREMQQKQRVYWDEMRRYRHVNPEDENACRKAVKRMDEIDIQIKLLQQEYHLKFMNVIPANKVLRVIKAEDKFHRQAFKKAAMHPHPQKGK